MSGSDALVTRMQFLVVMHYVFRTATAPLLPRPPTAAGGHMPLDRSIVRALGQRGLAHTAPLWHGHWGVATPLAFTNLRAFQLQMQRAAVGPGEGAAVMVRAHMDTQATEG
jgi:hypothetical protein